MANPKKKKKKKSPSYPGKTGSHPQQVDLSKLPASREDRFKWIKRIAALVLTVLLLFGMVIMPVIFQTGY